MAPLGVGNDQGPAAPTDPYQNPVDRFAQLDEATRKLLEDINEEDVSALRDILKAWKRAATIGWFFKWLVVGLVGLFLAGVTLGEGILKVLTWTTWPRNN